MPHAGPSVVCRAGGWLLVGILAAALLPRPLLAGADFPETLIVPSRAIGLFRLGMSVSEVQLLRRTAPCDVQALFTEGKAFRLETNCGGAYRTAEYVQVGAGPTRALFFYGTPDRITSSNFANIRAEWLHYNGGIAFRVVYGDGPGNALIQAIAVFKGNSRLIVRKQELPTAPTPLPGVGE